MLSSLVHGGHRPSREDGDIVPAGVEAPIATIAASLDLGASRFATGESLGFDIRVPDLGRLLRSVLAASETRGLHVMVDLRTRLDRLTAANVTRLVDQLRTRPTFRMFVLDGERLVENICIRPWARSGPSRWRALADSAPVAQILEGSLPGPGWPLPIDTVASFPIDAVYTWVDANDPRWREQFARYRDLAALDLDRYAQSDELRYSLRSLDMFAPWVRRIHILSNCAPPSWFVASDRIRWVYHEQVIPAEYLPLFNSHAIETFLHRVPELAEHFLYLNDDVLVWNDVFPGSFFTADGRTIASLAPHGAIVSWWQAMDAGTALDWQAARVNGARLVLERYGFLPTRQHEHVAHALRQSRVAALEAELPEAFETVRRSRFRVASDIPLIAFVYHHWAELHGQAVTRFPKRLTIDTHGINQLDPARLTGIDFLCVNDSDGSAVDDRAQRAKRRLFDSRLSIPGSAEKLG